MIQGVKRSALIDCINEWILNERDRAIVKRRLCDGITYEQLAEQFDLSVRQTKNIIYRYERIIREKLRELL